MAQVAQVNAISLLCIADWPAAVKDDGETVLAQIQHFVKYVHSHPTDYATVEKVSALVLDHEQADYEFAKGLYDLVGWPCGMSADA